MTQLKNILNNSRNTFFKLLINWTTIAGKSNRDIMKPNRISKQILYVAVPNNMALRIVRRLEPEILKNVQAFSGKTSVKEIRFFSDPSKFPDLVVRVTGFSAYFASLSEEMRQMVVDRIIDEN